MRKIMLQIPIVVGLLGLGILIGSTGRADLGTAAFAQTPSRVFELRTYTTHEGRLDDLHRRFRDHTMRLFEKHGMTNVGYWVPQDSALAANTLIYVLAHPSREAAATNWEAFGSDPEWQTAQAQSEEAGPIVQRVESMFIEPTDYSPLK